MLESETPSCHVTQAESESSIQGLLDPGVSRGDGVEYRDYFVAVPLKRDVITHDRLWKGLVVVLLGVRGIAAAAAG